MMMQPSWRVATVFLVVAVAWMLVAADNAADYGYEDTPAAAAPGLTASATPQPPDNAPSIHLNQWHTPAPGDYLDYNQRERLIQRGKLVYNKYCVGCHGEQGDGQGPAAERLITKPRDFRTGIYKFRSTDSSSLPLDEDLHRTLIRGLSRVSMPGFPLLPEHDLVAVIQYIKHFYPRWDEEAPRRVRVFVPAPPADLDDPQRILRGRVVYIAMQCGKCHGIDGQGTGATQTHYVDAWGHEQKPFNFTRGRLKGGDNPEDIYRTFHTGLRSIMPAYNVTTLASTNVDTFNTQQEFLLPGELETLRPVLGQFPATPGEVFSKMNEAERERLGVRNSWDLVAYIQSLRKNTSTRAAVLGEPDHR